MSNKFLGMTKVQFFGVILVIIVLSFAGQAWEISKLETIAHQNRMLATQAKTLAVQGAQAHRSLCILSGDLQLRIAGSEAFLKLTVPEREAKYGKAIGDIPENVIKQQITNEQSTFKALGHQTCPKAGKDSNG